MFYAGGKTWVHTSRTQMGAFFFPSITFISALEENKPVLSSFMLALIMPSHKLVLWFIIKIKYIFSVRSEVLDKTSWKCWQKNAVFHVSNLLYYTSKVQPMFLNCWGSGRMLVDSCSPGLGMMETVKSQLSHSPQVNLYPCLPQGAQQIWHSCQFCCS